MTDRFQITIDPARSLLRVKLVGHWTVETVEDYRSALRAAVAKLLAQGGRSGHVLALVDTRDGSVAQSQDVISAYKSHVATADLVPHKLATLVSSTLFKRQVERIAMPNQRLFTDEAEAEAWLLSPT